MNVFRSQIKQEAPLFFLALYPNAKSNSASSQNGKDAFARNGHINRAEIFLFGGGETLAFSVWQVISGLEAAGFWVWDSRQHRC